ncbi:MAG: c-type cytochrome [Gammaproteobacteria bacterium]
MKRYFEMIGLGFVLALGASIASAQNAIEHGDDWPDWAYGLLAPLSPEDRMAPPCPDDSRPIDCAYIGSVPPEDGVKRSLPGTDLTFTRNEAYFDYGPADWYPGDHPPMPPIVANGRQADGLRACALCHYPSGQGKMENGHVAGLPADYILQQLDAFVNGTRRSADIRKANTNEMAMIAAGMSEQELAEVAEYFSSMPFRQMVRVIEAEEAPRVRVTSNGLMLPLPDEPMMPLGQRIIEIPDDAERTEMSRDPRGGFIVYAPLGSLAKGEELVTSGAGRTIQCGLCHGPDQTGIGPIPSIAGRTASYTMRQLWDMKLGTRQSPIMAPVVMNLSADDMLAIVAYLASLPP